MPLTERFIDQRFSYLNGRFIDEEGQEGSSLPDVQMGSMYGTLVQLGYLAQHAHQLLDELCEEARALDGRISALTGRTKTLVEYMDSIAPPTAFSGGATHRSIASVGPLPEAEPLLVEKQVNGLFTRESQPASIRSRYRSPAVAEMPEFHKIDAVLQANKVPQTGPCAVQYSYPEFFFNEWKKEEEDRLLKLEEERKQRKLERRARRQQLREVRGSQKNSAINVKQLDWRKKYAGGDGITPTHPNSARISANRNSVKELIQKRERDPLSSPGMAGVSSPSFTSPAAPPKPTSPPELHVPPTLQLGANRSLPPLPQPPVGHEEDKPSASSPPRPTPPPIATQPPPARRPSDAPRPTPPPIPTTDDEPEPQPPQQEEEEEAAPAPARPSASPPSSLLAAIRSPPRQLKPVAEDDDAQTTAPPPAFSNSDGGGGGGGKRIINAALLQDIAGGARLRSASVGGAEGGEAAGPGASSSPQARAPHPMAAAGLSNDLLSSIAKGRQLKPASPEAAARPVATAKMSMLSEIKLNKTKLKHVDKDAGAGGGGGGAAGKKGGAAPSLATEVQNILARRKFLQAQSDSDSDEEDEWKD